MINLIVNGNSYSYPQPGDKANTGWGSQATNWSSAVTAALTSLGLGGTLTPTPNAVVDISSTTKGILIPRLTTTQRNAITSPATSLLIFNTTLGVFQYYTGSAWITIGAKIPDNVQFDGTLLVNGNISTNGDANITGKALTGNGLVSAPTYSFINDSNSGLYRISEDKIGFAANGVRQGEFGVGYGGFTGNIIQVVRKTGTNNYTFTADTLITDLDTAFTPKYSNSLIIITAEGVFDSTASAVTPGAGLQILIDNVAKKSGFFGGASLNNMANNLSISYSEILASNATLNITVKGLQYSGSGAITLYGAGLNPHYLTIMEIQR